MPEPQPSLTPPGPSYLKELPAAAGDGLSVGMTSPSTLAEDWWVALLWCARNGRLIRFSDLAPATGVPEGSPLHRLGPALSGNLSGMILEADGRQQLRLRLAQPPEDENRPWEAPLVVLAGFRFEPARTSVMRDTELAQTVLAAFRDALPRLSY